MARLLQDLSDTAHPAFPDASRAIPVGPQIPTVYPMFWRRAAEPELNINPQPGAAAKAILSEIARCAQQLLETGVASSIDLRFMKLIPEERATLAELLGHGEVSAVIESVGRSEVLETAIPCVWWVRHFNTDDSTVGEIIEITDIPDLLVGDRHSVALGLEALRACLASGIPSDPATRPSS
jgi:hypothetical protein